MRPTLLVKRLILVGHRKNYVVPFYPGVNIIYGDADTGKSSVLELVSYCLGARHLSLYEELESAVKYAVLEVQLNETVYAIRRDIFNPARAVEVFRALFEQIDSVVPRKFAPGYRGSAATRLTPLSDFLLESLNLPRVKLKKSPSKDVSTMDRLSFRDLFKFCYLSQDDVGSKRILDGGNFAVETKNRETFKYIYNVLDSNIADVQAEISEKTRKRNELRQGLGFVTEFLRENELSTQAKLDNEIAGIEQKAEDLRAFIREMDGRMASDIQLDEGIRDQLDEVDLSIESLERDVASSARNIERFARLANDYLADIQKLEAVRQANSLIGENSPEIDICPVCGNSLQGALAVEKFNITDSSKIDSEVKSLKRRIRELSALREGERNKQESAASRLRELKQQKSAIRKYIDDTSREAVAPHLAERDLVVSEIAALTERRDKYAQLLRLRTQQRGIVESIKQHDKDIAALQQRLQALQEQSPSIDGVTTELGELLDDYLRDVGIRKRKGVGIGDRTLLPVVRGIDYRELTSGGLRTIVSIGYFVSILASGLKSELNLPAFLMIDTVGKYLGKTKDKYLAETDDKGDQEEGVADPSKYGHIYEYLIGVSESFEEKGLTCQIVLVDNDVPPAITAAYAGFVVRHFGSAADGLPIGLIDDAESL